VLVSEQASYSFNFLRLSSKSHHSHKTLDVYGFALPYWPLCMHTQERSCHEFVQRKIVLQTARMHMSRLINNTICLTRQSHYKISADSPSAPAIPTTHQCSISQSMPASTVSALGSSACRCRAFDQFYQPGAARMLRPIAEGGMGDRVDV